MPSENSLSFNDLLRFNDIDPANVLIMRHQPQEPTLRRAFYWIAVTRPDLFNQYQSVHYERQEKQLSKATYLASFIGNRPRKALFVSLCKNNGAREIDYKQYWKIKANKELRAYGMRGFDGSRPSVLLFDLKPMNVFSDWKARLMIDWTGGERSWTRWASENTFAVEAITEKTALEPKMPAWDEILLDWSELRELWPSWRTALSSMRGVYFIFDRTDGKGYVGSAYGAENILGRWTHYAKSGHGGNKLLRQRNPTDFRFSILELVAPSLPPEEVIKREQSWKKRLSTVQPLGLNEN